MLNERRQTKEHYTVSFVLNSKTSKLIWSERKQISAFLRKKEREEGSSRGREEAQVKSSLSTKLRVLSRPSSLILKLLTSQGG